MVWLPLLAELAVKCGGVLSNSHYEALGRKDDEANVLTIKARILDVTPSKGYFEK